MSNRSSFVPDPAARFFDNYLIDLKNASVPEKQQRWYIKRVEEFIKAQNGRKIKNLTATDIERYLEMLGRQSRQAGWQLYQCVDAIRILYCESHALPLCENK